MSVKIVENIELKRHTTLKTGGSARYFVVVSTFEELNEAVVFAEQKRLPHLILGGGSNLLISDDGFSGIVIKIELKGREYRVVDSNSCRLIAASGEVFDEVISDSLSRGYFGLENLSAIPGTVGATPVQNVGAYGVEVRDLISQVDAYHIPTKTIKNFSKSDCKFGYRDSFFKTELGKEFVITAVHFELSKIAPTNLTYRDLSETFLNQSPTHLEVREAVCKIRAGKFPDWNAVGTAGSFFKNPIVSVKEGERLVSSFPTLPVYKVDENNVKIPLGFVLEKLCDLKGYRQGGVGLYEKQALVLVNYEEASSQEIINFVNEIAEKVFAVTGITIEPEVRFIM